MNVRLISLGVLVAVGGFVGADADDAPAPFKITTKRKDDRVEVLSEKGKIVFDVKSPFGISQAVLERQGEKWPEAVGLRLHLKGLEHFRASNGSFALGAAAGRDGKARVWKDGKEEETLDDKSPLWMDVRVVGGKADETTPTETGYLEMTLPKAFFVGNPKSITLEWIDFYR